MAALVLDRRLINVGPDFHASLRITWSLTDDSPDDESDGRTRDELDRTRHPAVCHLLPVLQHNKQFSFSFNKQDP